MTTTPTFWGNEITVTTDINAFRPQVTALSDNTFFFSWESSNELFARHLSELGSFLPGGNFLSGVSANPKPLFNPVLFQQIDGRVVAAYGEVDATSDGDIHWASLKPSGTGIAIEETAVDETLLDATARGAGGAVIYQYDSPGPATHLVLRLTDSIGNQASNQIFVGPHAGETQQDPALAGMSLGRVAVAYGNFNPTTSLHDVRLYVYSSAGVALTQEVFVGGLGSERFPDVVKLLDGNLVVTWQQDSGIGFQRFFDGGAAGLNGATQPDVVPNSLGGLAPKVTALNDGGFIIAWTTRVGLEMDGSAELDVVMQRFSSDGTAIGSQLVIDKPGDQGLFDLSIATLDDGRVILSYGSETGDSTNITTLNFQVVDPRETTINGSNGADNIVGREEASTIFGSHGNDKLTGRSGVDTAVFTQNLASHLTDDFGSFIFIAGPEGLDTHIGIERFQFADGTVHQGDENRFVDDLFYFRTNGDVWAAKVDPEAHYAANGWREGRDPNPFFDTSAYLSANPDVRSAGVNPFDHYMAFGWKEGRDPSAAFDGDIYLAQNPDVKAAGINPFEHYLAFGRGEFRGAHEAIGSFIQNGFDGQFYLLTNEDVGAAGVDPLAHFNAFGWQEGRDPNAFFDTAGYLNTYADVRIAGMNPLDHYMAHGWKENRDPSTEFDTSIYLAVHTDVAQAGMNPLHHYLNFGALEGRLAFNDGVWG